MKNENFFLKKNPKLKNVKMKNENFLWLNIDEHTINLKQNKINIYINNT
jgi:hypothetical protein